MMQYDINDIKNQIIQGDTLEILKKIPNNNKKSI